MDSFGFYHSNYKKELHNTAPTACSGIATIGLYPLGSKMHTEMWTSIHMHMWRSV